MEDQIFQRAWVGGQERGMGLAILVQPAIKM
jgi:hypothetical protein